MSCFMPCAKVHFRIVKFGHEPYLFSIFHFNLHFQYPSCLQQADEMLFRYFLFKFPGFNLHKIYACSLKI